MKLENFWLTKYLLYTLIKQFIKLTRNQKSVKGNCKVFKNLQKKIQQKLSLTYKLC